MYQLIAFDMDGTLLTNQHLIAPESQTAIQAASQAGKEVVLSTGRALVETTFYRQDLPTVRYAILASGALVYDYQEEKVLAKQAIPASIVDIIRKQVAEEDLMVVAMIDGQVYVQASHVEGIAAYHMSPYQSLYHQVAVLVENSCDLLAQERNHFEKINLYHRTKEARDLTYQLLSQESITIVKSEVSGVEVTAKGVEKGQGLGFLSRLLDIPLAACIAVGDADNDESVMKVAGLGVAMGNANDRIKDLADVIVADNNSGGCAEAIERYLLNNYPTTK